MTPALLCLHIALIQPCLGFYLQLKLQLNSGITADLTKLPETNRVSPQCTSCWLAVFSGRTSTPRPMRTAQILQSRPSRCQQSPHLRSKKSSTSPRRCTVSAVQCPPVKISRESSPHPMNWLLARTRAQRGTQILVHPHKNMFADSVEAAKGPWRERGKPGRSYVLVLPDTIPQSCSGKALIILVFG